jgi:putative phosphoesterase
MKRLLVLSDTHGKTTAIDLALMKAGAFDAAVHLGDHVRDALYMRDLGKVVYCVKGNCDPNDEADAEMILHMGGLKILITHGHKYGVKFGRDKLVYRALELEANAVFYGHTHVPYNAYSDGILLLNPGSAAEPRLQRPTFAIAEIESGTIRASLKTL